MGIEKGSRLGPYEIVSRLGAGGMGEVYRAKDTRLGRDVAIKALPDEFSRDPERLARFEREARLLASLHHANIASIHGLEVVDGRRYLVLECVEGETLAARIRRGAIPVDETIDIARAIAAALEAAHEGGIVHRDLKPGNVMLTSTGEVKVLDFGLAKGGDGVGPASDAELSASPTRTAGTQAGVILGTAAYMSPEQARGKVVDRRTDIWSFGCVVFECLTARPIFVGETVSDIIAGILQGEPAWSALPANTPERLRALLSRCLEKDLKRRQRDIGDVRIELEDMQALRESNRVSRAAVAARGQSSARLWGLVAFAAIAAAAVTWFAAGKWNAPPPARPVRFEIAGPKQREFAADGAAVSLSPDGQSVAMIAVDSSSYTSSIWIRRLDSLTPRELPGTKNATLMFWSPDSKFLAFFANDQMLSKVAIAGGEPERICEVKSARGGTWSRKGVILLAPFSNGGIHRVSANGGEPVAITHPDSSRGETGHRFPYFLPDGNHFLFAGVPVGADGKLDIYIGSLDGGTPRHLQRFESGAIYCDPGWLLTTRDNILVAQRFIAGTRRLQGEPVSLGDGPNRSQFTGAPRISASATGVLGYANRSFPPQRLAWRDLAGHETGIPGLPSGTYAKVIVSPDGRRALLDGVTESQKGYVSLVDLERGTLSRLTSPNESAGDAQWSPDGRRIAYLNDSKTIVVRSLADGSTRSFLTSDPAYKSLEEWSQDGRYLVYLRLDAATKWDVWLQPVDGDSTPRAVVRTEANEEQGRLSPDGRWIAFNSDETGVSEAYVRALDSAGLKYQVTTGGGGTWYWSRDGKSLVLGLLERPFDLFRAPVLNTDEFAVGAPRKFMQFPEDFGWAYPAPDEKRFLVLRAAEKPERQTITVLQNWQAALRRP